MKAFGQWEWVIFPQIFREGVQQVPPLADAKAPVCSEPRVDTSGWVTDRPTGRSSRIADVRLRVPHEYLAAHDDSDVRDGKGEHWGRILGSWTVERPGERSEERIERSFALWVGPEEGYPTAGLPPDTEQLDLRECRMPAAGAHALRLVRYTVAGPEVRHGFLVGAYWDVSPGVWLSASAYGPDRRSQDEAQAIFESVRFTVPGSPRGGAPAA
jgi:hypothetical protein